MTSDSDFPCISSFGYLNSPDFLFLGLHSISVISTPIYCLGMYCILFKTPDVMKSVKWYLFVLHFWIVLTDYSISLATVPYLLLPTLSGFPLGFLRYFGVSTSVQTVSVIWLVSFVFVATLSIFEDRYYILCGANSHRKFWKYARQPWLLFHYLGLIGVLTIIFITFPDQKLAKQQILKVCRTDNC